VKKRESKKNYREAGEDDGRRDGRIEVGAYPLNPMYTLLSYALSGEIGRDYGSYGMEWQVARHMVTLCV
jgi:hypothetical protein